MSCWGSIYFYTEDGTEKFRRNYISKDARNKILERLLHHHLKITHYHIVPHQYFSKRDKLDEPVKQFVRPPAKYDNRQYV